MPIRLRVVTLAIVAASAASALPGSASTAARAASRCVGTLPTRAVPPEAGFGPAGFNYGSNRLRVELNWAHGTLRAGVLPDGGSFATINRDGSVATKVGWWVRDPSKLVITGRRLDEPAPPLRAAIPSGYGPAYRPGSSLGFQPTGLTFPTVGCWRVVGRAGSARLTFVVGVTKPSSTVG